MTRIFAATAALVMTSASVAAAVPVTLQGSPESMVRQNRVARESEVRFLRTPAEVHAAIDAGELVPITGNDDFRVNRISFPFARPEMRLFLERFSAQYRAACGEALVVTSLTRPLSAQPANAHRLSVHPTGLAVDVRISQQESCRRYLEDAMLAMEREGVLDITRERTPPHYHVALFPEAYRAYVGESPDHADAPDWAAVAEAGPGAPLTDAAGVRSLLPGADRVADEASRGGWLSRLLTLPVRIVGRIFGG